MLIFPTLHLGGTHAAILVLQYRNAIETLRDAIEALTKAEPNARDYIQTEQYWAAQHQHRTRIEKVQAVLGDIEALQQHCVDHG